MQRIYLDNAATTRLDPEVLEAMLPILQDGFGNPSSIHAHGREIRSVVERARKSIAGMLNTSPSEIFFTSGGTEADNTAIVSSIHTFGLKHAITSKIEHHAVLHTLEHLAKLGEIKLSYVDLDEKGHINMAHLAELLQNNSRSLVSLMQANNEIGNLIDLNEVGEICQQYDAIFHSDTVQTVGHFKHDLQATKADFIVGAAHKFHGPKGIGFLYVSNRLKINPFIHGGAQERNMRGGTENVYGIVGLAKALEVAYRDMEAHRQHIEALKLRMKTKLQENIAGISFNGDSANFDKSNYIVLSASFPERADSDMLLFNLDIAKVSCSGGSACSSGTNIGSHVLNQLNIAENRGNVRFSFSKFNTEAEVDYTINLLTEMYDKAE
jgi:cysteine desulfurase